MTLTEFLLARIAEDEVVALAASDSPWRTEGSKYVSGAYIISRGGGSVSHATEVTTPDAEHIVRHDPARVLAECEAKRRIVELHAPVIPVSPFSKCGHPGCDQSHSEKRLPPACPTCPTSDVDGACETLYTLAIPYVDHPDYRDEWKP